MFSPKRFFGKGDLFFDLLEAGADEAQQSVRAIVELLNDPQNGQAVEKSLASRRQEKQICEQITALLCRTFITPLEREDIEALSVALSRITKVAKKFVQRLLLFGARVHTGVFLEQAAILDRAASTLCEMVCDLPRGARLDRVQEQNGRLQQYEGEADNLMRDLLCKLYDGQHSALEMIVTRDLLEMLEKVIDRHRDAGNVVFQIALKNS